MTPIQVEKKINKGILTIKSQAMSRIKSIIENPTGVQSYDYYYETPSEHRINSIECVLRRMEEDIYNLKSKYARRMPNERK